MKINSIKKIRDKFLLIIISILTIAFTLFSLFIYSFEKKQVIAKTQSYGNLLVRTAAISFSNALLSDDNEKDIKKTVTILQTDSNILNVILKDTNQNLIYFSNSNYNPKKTNISKNVLHLSYPIYSDSHLLGTLQLDYSIDKALSRMSMFKYMLITTSFIIIVLGIVAASILSASVTNQINLLTDGIKRVANNNYSHKVPIVSEDELGQLAASFNQLFLDLKNAYKDSYSKTKKLILEKNKLRSIIDNLEEGVIVSDQDLKIIEFNKSAEHIFDVYSKVISGQYILELINSNDLSDAINKIASGQLQKNSIKAQLEISGAQKLYKVNNIKAINEHGDFTGIISVLSDVSKESIS